MGHSRWLHGFALVASVYGLASGQPGSGSAEPPKPAGASPVESTDVPPWRASPARFAVAPFENHSNARAFDWLVAGAPFEIAEKTEDILGLEPTGGPLHVGAEHIEPEPEPVAAFGTARDATWVITGWADRPNWQLRVELTLWKVSGTGTTRTAVVAAEAQRMGEVKAYHQLLGEALAEVWSKAGIIIDVARSARLQRPLASDLYAVNLMSRGLGYLTGALGAVSLKAAQHDLERAVFIDPKCFEAQRLLGELYLVLATQDPKAGGDPKYAGRAASKFAYANDLAPDDIASARAAALAATRSGKHEVARDLLRKLVTRKPWDLEARYQFGAALWNTGDATAAERQLAQVTAKQPDHLQARRVLVLIHASRSDTSKLVTELEAIANRAPFDLDVKLDLATAYSALGRFDKATAQLEHVAVSRPGDFALIVRVGDTKRRGGDLAGALAWYTRAQRLVPESSFPGYQAAQALFDAKRIPEALRAYTNLQRYRDDLPTAEHALGTIALLQNRPDDAAWYFRRSVREAPRVIEGWRALVAAELSRKDPEQAQKVLDRALPFWPRDGQLQYLAGVVQATRGDRAGARTRFKRALELHPGHAAARAAISMLDAQGTVTLSFVPELVRPWGDAQGLERALASYAATDAALAKTRTAYQTSFLKLLATLHKGPLAPGKAPPVKTCPVARVAPLWAQAFGELRRYERLGGELERTYRFIARHDEVGATAALLPNRRAQVAAAKKSFRTALADVGELRAEWLRGIAPELRAAGCSEKLLAAAVADPERYRVAVEDKPPVIPQTQPPRPKPRATFYVDNTKCADPVDVWIDGAPLGQVAPGRRSALVADGGERTLCLIVPGAAQCGDRGTLRQVYLHDGWAATMHCPK